MENTTEIKAHAESLVSKAAAANKSEDALRFSQAALNAANVLVALAHAASM